MEKNMSSATDVLTWLPIGYMISFPYDNFPSNFIEVDGQRLSKADYQDVFDVLKGNVVDDGDTFVLPQKSLVTTKFSSSAGKIIMKLRPD